jgi:hypothetical protein
LNIWLFSNRGLNDAPRFKFSKYWKTYIGQCWNKNEKQDQKWPYYNDNLEKVRGTHVVTLHWKYNNNITCIVDHDFILSWRFEKGVIIRKNTILQLFSCIHFAKICFHYRILVIFAMPVIFNCDVIVKRFPRQSTKVIYLPYDVFFNCGVIAQIKYQNNDQSQTLNVYI